jgi:ABC-type glutathione transport system ATPase component
MLWTPKTGPEMADKVLSVASLNVSFNTRGTIIKAVNDLSFDLQKNEVLGIVGESGSGKSQTVLSLMGLLESNGMATGSAIFNNKEILGLPDKDLNKIRGNEIAMIFQDPMSSLNPYITIGDQMTGVLRQHKKQNKKEAKERCIEMLDAVRLPNPEKRINGYSFELSGGMRQRVMIATALLTNPDLLIADEPTTALDVTVQEKILDLVLEVMERFSMSVILITHDLGVVARTCDNVLVLKNGTKQEYGNIDQIFYSPQAEHTQELLFKSKELNDPQAITKTEATEKPNTRIKNLSVFFPIPKDGPFSRQEYLRAIDNLSIDINEGEVLGVVGESGSGKSTLARCILKLQKPSSGKISVFSNDILKMSRKQTKRFRKNTQVVFQDPFSSLNPRMTVSETLLEPLKVFFQKTTKNLSTKKITSCLEDVGLNATFLGRYPHELSGGQCQRVAIARALMSEPKLLICDEAVSALDASIRSEIIELLLKLQRDKKLTMLFIAHDLAVVNKICDRVVVMHQGKLIEQGETKRIFQHPANQYTKDLLDSVPVPDPRLEKEKYLRRLGNKI